MSQKELPHRQWFRCERCKTKEMFVKPSINHRLHWVLVICTGGLWLISYVSILVGQYFQPWICENCSHRQYPPGTVK